MAALPEMELQCPAEEGYERLLIAGAEVGTLEEYNDLARYVVIKARYGLNPVRVRASIVGLTDNTCKAQPPPRPTLIQELAADVVAVESELAKDLAAVEGELAKGVTAAERALAADAALLEGDALAAARSLAARTSDLGRAAARVPGRVSAAAAEELAQVECEASDAARFLARVEKEYLETPLQKVARRLGLAK